MSIFEFSSNGEIEELHKLFKKANSSQQTTWINSLNNDGLTPLMLACIAGHLTIVQFLIDKGADVNILSKQGLLYNFYNIHFTFI